MHKLHCTIMSDHDVRKTEVLRYGRQNHKYSNEFKFRAKFHAFLAFFFVWIRNS